MAATGIGLSDLTNPDPNISPKLIQTIQQSPEMMQLLSSGGSGKIKVGGTEYTITNGRVMNMDTGSPWGPIALAGAVATGGMLLPEVLGMGGADAAASGAGAAGGAGAVNTVGPLAGGLTAPAIDAAAPGGIAAFADTGATGVLGTIGKYAKALGGVGGAISSATDAAAKLRIDQNDPYVQRGNLETSQRNQDLRNIYMASEAQNPTHSPFDPVAPTLPSGDYAAALKNISSQGAADLAKAPQYGVGSFPSLQPGVLGKIGQWAGPILKTIGSIPGLFG